LHLFNLGKTQSGLEEWFKNTLVASCVVEDDIAYMNYIEVLQNLAVSMAQKDYCCL